MQQTPLRGQWLRRFSCWSCIVADGPWGIRSPEHAGYYTKGGTKNESANRREPAEVRHNRQGNDGGAGEKEQCSGNPVKHWERDQFIEENRCIAMAKVPY